MAFDGLADSGELPQVQQIVTGVQADHVRDAFFTTLGVHTDDVLESAGLDAVARADLRARGVI